EETGLLVEVTGLRAVLADVVTAGDVAVHNDRIVYDVAVRGGRLRDELDGTTDAAAWYARDDLPALPLVPFAAEFLALAALARASRLFPPCRRPFARSLRSFDSGPPAGGDAKPAAARGQRFGVYGLVTGPAGRVLLTLIADGYPGAGRWHLPGGGTDHGEQPESAFLRELAEESDQLGRVTGLLDVSHRRNPAALGPEGYPIDFHSVRVLYRAVVDRPTEPTVTEAAGGSTARAAWFPPADAARLPLTDIADYGLGWLRRLG
ncbi:MAG TPA: NUDIX domain-containing protein, partial [Pilimelia sp.]|nr:NUDIX domain-containing protein [Pilimelia sp.]